MILSVTGAAKKFQVAEKIKNAFKIELMKAAKTTDSWIISGGTDVGVMRLVGDAIEENPHTQDLVVLGIASHKRIDKKNIFENTSGYKAITYETVENKPEYSLNSSHSTFILVNNTNPNDDEIDFRNKCEQKLKDKFGIPMVLIVVGGGKGTLKTIKGALDFQIPVILVAVSH